jgi:prophage tail gpP-like protein
MKKYTLAIVMTAGALLLTGCGSSAAPTAKEGVATSDQMSSIDKVARAVAAEKYADAASAGYNTFDSSGSFTQDAGKMAEHRKEDADEWDAIKADFDKGCTLVADSVDSMSAIISNVVCKGEEKPTRTISVQYLMGKLAYIGARD